MCIFHYSAFSLVLTLHIINIGTFHFELLYARLLAMHAYIISYPTKTKKVCSWRRSGWPYSPPFTFPTPEFYRGLYTCKLSLGSNRPSKWPIPGFLKSHKRKAQKAWINWKFRVLIQEAAQQVGPSSIGPHIRLQTPSQKICFLSSRAGLEARAVSTINTIVWS